MNHDMKTGRHARSQSAQWEQWNLVGRVRRVLMLVIMVPLLAAGLPALAGDDDEYDPTEAGNPLRIVAYVLHPVGVVLDTLIFRPAHWLGSKEPIKTLVGKDD